MAGLFVEVVRSAVGVGFPVSALFSLAVLAVAARARRRRRRSGRRSPWRWRQCPRRRRRARSCWPRSCAPSATATRWSDQQDAHGGAIERVAFGWYRWKGW